MGNFKPYSIEGFHKVLKNSWIIVLRRKVNNFAVNQRTYMSVNPTPQQNGTSLGCSVNPFVPNVPFLYPLKTSKNLTIV